MNGKKAKMLRILHGNPAPKRRTYRGGQGDPVIATGSRRAYRDAKKTYREANKR